MAKSIKRTIEKLAAADPSVRRGAAEELAEGDERAIYPLVRALSDANAGVQDAAMRALIRIGGEVTAYMVLPLLRESSLLRNTALIILKELGRSSVPLLYPLLKDKDPDIRKFALDLLGEIKEGVEPAPIVPYLKDPNANVRAAAAKTVSELGYKAAIPELINALHDDEWVCFSALEALGELRAENAIEHIAQLLPSSSAHIRNAVSDAVRLAVIETLGKLGSERSIGVLRSYLPRTDADERYAVIKSLIQIGITPDMADLTGSIITMIREGDWEDRKIALRGLATLNCREAVPLLVDLAGSLDPSLPENEERIVAVRAAIGAMDAEEELLKLLDAADLKFRGKHIAIELLGELNSRKAVPRLIEYLNDVRRDLRRASSQALGDIGATESIESLLETSQRDADAHVRRSAIEALGTIRSKDAFRPLLDMLDLERYPDVIERIVGALLKIDAPAFLSNLARYGDTVRELVAKTVQEIDILLTLADDGNKKVRSAALYGLGRAGTDRARSRLIGFLGDRDPEIRKAAVVGLGEARYCSPELFNALIDPDQWVRFYAVKAIASSCDREEAIREISALLHDASIPVVMSVIDAIAALGGREAYEALSTHGEHPNPDVRDKIKEALGSL